MKELVVEIEFNTGSSQNEPVLYLHFPTSAPPWQNQSSFFNLISGVGGVRVSVRVGADPLCHMSKPEAGHHRWHQHRHLCVGDGNLQGEGQVTYAQTGKGKKKPHTLFPRNPTQGPEVALIPRALTKYLILKKSKVQECTV